MPQTEGPSVRPQGPAQARIRLLEDLRGSFSVFKSGSPTCQDERGLFFWTPLSLAGEKPNNSGHPQSEN